MTRCSSDIEVGAGNDRLLSLIAWAVQMVTEPMHGQQAIHAGQLSSLAEQLTLLTELVSNLTDRVTRLEAITDQLSNNDTNKLSQLYLLDTRLDQLEKQSLLSAAWGQMVANCSGSAPGSILPHARDCSDLPAGLRSGIYLLRPGLDQSGPPIPAFCDLETDGGGWTVFQRRAVILPRLDFYKGWQQYKNGFGELDMEFWWGLENIFQLTGSKDRRYELRIDMGDFENETRYAVYQGFRLSSELDGYRLHASNYSGTAGDSLSEHYDMKFSTFDKDQDKYHINCAASRKGAWWYNRCYHSNLNGRHFPGQFRTGLAGTTWKTWRGGQYSLSTVEMKVRPTIKSLNN